VVRVTRGERLLEQLEVPSSMVLGRSEGYLLVVNGDHMGRKNLLVVDAVTGKPLASMGVKPILSYGYTVKVITCQHPVKSSSFL